MPTGPFDRRSKRSRCSACSSSHLKCDGADPCNQCTRRNVSCSYQKTKLVISLDQSRVKTVADFSNGKRSLGRTPVPTPTHTPMPRVLTLSATSLSRHLYYFDIFAQRNNFVASKSSYDMDIKLLLGTEPGHYLVHAVTALGALQSARLSHASCQEDSKAALQAYSSSVVALREAMTQLHSPSRLHVLWTTLLLGLFELMNSESGDGWLVHMVYGTGAALQASGPALCLSGAGQSFFLQARTFEISRALLLGDLTFLSRPEWATLSRSLNESGQKGPRALDKLLDIIVQCSHLRVRTGTFLDSFQDTEVEDRRDDAERIAIEGLQLRLNLETWRRSENPDSTRSINGLTQYENNLITLSDTFFAAISIFLSGVFDYQVSYWQNWGLSIPTLPEAQIQAHVRTILELTEYALDHTSISPLLFLFSLRIAGARSYEHQGQEQVLGLLTRVGEQFTVARVFKEELRHLWKTRAGAVD